METTENMTTVRASDISPAEIYEARNAIWDLVDDNKIERDSILLDAIEFILDTLEDGVDITITSRPAPEEYVLAH